MIFNPCGPHDAGKVTNKLVASFSLKMAERSEAKSKPSSQKSKFMFFR
jgi:hypothetical protein